MKIIVKDVLAVYEYLTKRKRWESIPNRGGHIISYQLSGRYDHTLRGERITVDEGTVFVINENDSYSVECIEEGRSLCVCFSAEGEVPTAAIDVKNDPRALEIFNRIMKKRNIALDSERYSAVSEIYALLSIVSESGLTRGQATRRESVIALRDYIAENYQRTDFDLGEAMPKELSTKHFNNVFRDSYGLTPTQYVIALRMNNAVSLLKNESLTVEEVAHMSGYDDVFYFSRLFKKRFGVSPSKYRVL